MALNPNSTLILLGSLSLLLTFISGAIPLLKVWKEDHLHHFVSFSAGILMATAFLQIFPDAIESSTGPRVGLITLLSFVLLFVLEKFIMLHPCEESHCDYHTVGIAAFIGMLIHTFFDGIVLGAALLKDKLGLFVFFAIMAHKIPSSFSLGSILKKAHWTHKKIFLFLFIFGSTIPFGAYISKVVLTTVAPSLLADALSFSFGTFLYISTSDFLPEVHRAGSHRIKNLISFLAGIIGVMLLTQVMSAGHSH